MPPPEPSDAGGRDRRVTHDLGEIVRALEAEGPMSPEDLSRLVGAAAWERGRFEQAVALAVADGLVLRDADGRLNAI